MSLICATLIFLVLAISRIMSKLTGSVLPARADPVVWYAIPWILCLLMFASPVIIHAEKIRIEHVLYISACALAFFIGTALHQFFREVGGDAVLPMTNENPVGSSLKKYAIVAAIGFAAILYDQISITGFSLTDRLNGDNLDAVRELRNSATAMGLKGPLDKLESLVAFVVIYFAGLLLFFRRRKLGGELGFRYVILGGLFITYIFLSTILVTGGRIQLVLLILLLMAIVSLDREKTFFTQIKSLPVNLRRTVVSLTVLLSIIVVILYSTVYIKARSGKVDNVLIMNIAHRAKVEPWLDSMAYRSPLLSSAIFQFSYFTTPVATFVYYFDLPKAQFPGPYLGQYNFWGVADRILRRFGMAVEVNPAIATDDPLGFRGYGVNIWRTSLIDYALDVGRAGALFVLLLLGYFSRMACYESYRSRDIFWVSAASVVLVVVAFTPFHALFNRSALISGTLFWSFAIILGRRFYCAFSPRRPTVISRGAVKSIQKPKIG